MIQGLFSVAAAIIGGAVASFAVLLLTSSRVRKERAFDRSLEWCESMMRAINAVGAAVTTASTASDPGREACWTETIRLYEKLIPLCGLKDMYAPMNAIEAIDAFMRELDMLIESHLDSHRTSTPVNCDNCLAELRRAATSLARIGRGHLGLKRLPDTMTDPSRRFLDTFRGRELGQHDDAFS
jgi:hypothetical protein